MAVRLGMKVVTPALVFFIALAIAPPSDAGAAENGVPAWKNAIAHWKAQKEHAPADNFFCYVCHLNYQEEDLAKTHQAAGVGCETCHGMSDKHSEDEDNVTPPDIMYSETGIVPFCLECHAKEDLIEKKPHTKLFSGEAKNVKTCTSCHGKEHRLEVRTRKWDKQTGKMLWDDGVRMMEEGPAAEVEEKGGIFAKDNLVAWCVVPFDAKKRGPVERAEMLKRLGFTKLAYDWRDEHVPTFEQEILALKEQAIEFFAFWGQHEEMFRLFAEYKIAPQVWMTAPSPQEGSHEEKVEAAAKQLLPLVERTRELGCKLGLYNHGGWGGEPQNMVAVCEWLQKNADDAHVGIVYNFHHGHDDIEQFSDLLALMKPYLLCVNLNGMNSGANPLILPIGQGQHEKAMLQTIAEGGYKGPIGILDHRTEMDAEESLRENLEGLKNLAAEL
jgi:sugar phosphate isomerase/epimerase